MKKLVKSILVIALLPVGAAVFIWGSWYLITVKVPYDVNAKFIEDEKDMYNQDLKVFINKVKESDTK